MFRNFSKKFNLKKSNSGAKAGFSLIEMVFVLTIFSIFSLVTLFNYGKFNTNIIMTNVVYEFALSFRQAQVFSLSTRAIDSGQGDFNQFNVSYGILADLLNPSNILLFADKKGNDGDGNSICENNNINCDITQCSLPLDNECQETISLTRNIFIRKICVSDDPDKLIDFENKTCHSNATSLERVHVIFKSPEPNPIITDINGQQSKKNIAFILSRDSGENRAVKILETGSISVDFINN